jgi:hypothetical protein
MTEVLQRAHELYCNPLEYMQGKMTKKKVAWAIVNGNLILDEKRQTLHAGVMQINGQKFLVMLCKLLSLTLKVHMYRERNTISPRKGITRAIRVAQKQGLCTSQILTHSLPSIVL